MEFRKPRNTENGFYQAALNVWDPMPLTPDNFTPVERTPWGGRYITEHFEEKIYPEKIGQVVGESWEVSCEPSFPSRILGSSTTLNAVISEFPREMLSENFIQTRGMAACELLVKILDAAEDLSVQVHPSNDDPYLKSDECGKFESWFVLHAEPGAGIYLGFKDSISKEQLSKILELGEDLRPYLAFVPVKVGDYFEIPNGVCHVIGKGVVVLEPQHLLHGKKGKTYRLYDWGRTYNENGQRDPNGRPRDLHIKESLRLVDPKKQCGAEFLASLRGKREMQNFHEGLHVETYGDNPFFKVHRITLLRGHVVHARLEDGFGALIPLGGTFALRPHGGKDSYWQKGQSGFLPFACFPLRIEAMSDTSLFLCRPAASKIKWEKDA